MHFEEVGGAYCFEVVHSSIPSSHLSARYLKEELSRALKFDMQFGDGELITWITFEQIQLKKKKKMLKLWHFLLGQSYS